MAPCWPEPWSCRRVVPVLPQLPPQGASCASPKLALEPPSRPRLSSESETDTLLDPRQGLLGINPRSRQRAICLSHQPLGNRPLGAMQTRQKYAWNFANSVGDHRALVQLQIERSADECLRHLQQRLSQRH